jgi:hypothetical protein
MLAKVTCRICVTFVKEAANITSMLGFTPASIALEDVRRAPIPVLNTRGLLEEYVDW